ncbi:aldehyde dehydrogenase family protein [Thalassotalea sp. HSM 43]|uniref:aldehyde dehydrogenase family protein n=1 Tax=Thalassotalea sp. HSM 43 TaxID=2552945 RepID=UPI0010801AF8|nr:aldehyde dehydrogenase family protein [Thalassotalea sp. HSM 43]QBY04220.1 aldehyde dehydrogenase family protein [Thalassotalea sp. HSM 43]
MNKHQFPMLINGELINTEDSIAVINPATEDIIGHAPQLQALHIEQALDGAEQAFTLWSAMTLNQRSALILRYAELLENQRSEIIDLLIAETGKPADNAEYDFETLITCLRFFIEEAKRIDQPVIVDGNGRFLNYVMRQPLGVVVGYLAWNFPLLNLGYKLGPVLASGCTAIIKPAHLTPLATLKCAEIAMLAGIPKGVINVITGDDYALTDTLLESDKVSLFTMIGSTKAGVDTMRTSCTNIKHFSVELGGNSPVVIYPDADLDKAAEDVVNLKFANTGQVCVSPNRCFVHESVYPQFITKAKAHVQGIEFGSGRTEGRLMGPLLTAEARERVITSINAAVDMGAELVSGGQIPQQPNKGYYLQPTILANVSTNMPLAGEEIFGPVLPIIKYSDDDDIIAMANDSDYGLAAYVYTQDIQKGLQAASQIQAGSVCINEVHYDVSLPHGGLKQSGVGKDCSQYSLQEYLTLKRVSVLVNP